MGYEYSMRPGFKGCSLPDSRGSEGAGVVTVLIMATLGAILARPSHAQLGRRFRSGKTITSTWER
jgi:hypothetical protein